MSVYVDALRPVRPTASWRWPKAAHLVADTLSELHAFARRVGLKRAWYQPRSFPHYDLTASRHRAALQLGATLVGRRELVAIIRRVREEHLSTLPICATHGPMELADPCPCITGKAG